MPEVVQTVGDRPAFIIHEGWKVAVSVHDAAYMRERRRWRLVLAEAHPDRGGAPSRFRDLQKQYKAWQLRELRWYQLRGLELPTGRHASGPEATAIIRRAHEESDVAKVWRKLRDGRSHSMSDLLEGCKSKGSFFRAINSIRSRGAEVATVSLSTGVYYQLVDGSLYQWPFNDRAAQRVGDVLSDGAVHSYVTLAERLNLSVDQIRSAVFKLRKRGARIVADRKARTYQAILGTDG